MCAFLRVIFKKFFNGSGKLEQDSATKIIVYTNWFYGVKPTDKQDGDTPEDTMIEDKIICCCLSVENYVATIQPSGVMGSVDIYFIHVNTQL